MNPGKMRHRVTIERPMAGESDEYNEVPIVWHPVAEAWAQVTPASSSESMRARRVGVEMSHRVVMRYRGGIDETYRLRLGERVFDIESVVNTDERCVTLELACTEQLHRA